MKCYSTDNENFNDTELEDAIASVWANEIIGVGDRITVYEGDPVPWRAADFLVSAPTDAMSENAYEEVGEYADGWPPCSSSQHQDLTKRIKEVVNQWADDHGLQPKFFRVENVRQIFVRIIDEDGNFEID